MIIVLSVHLLVMEFICFWKEIIVYWIVLMGIGKIMMIKIALNVQMDVKNVLEMD
jgi:hypothetical protein